MGQAATATPRPIPTRIQAVRLLKNQTDVLLLPFIRGEGRDEGLPIGVRVHWERLPAHVSGGSRVRPLRQPAGLPEGSRWSSKGKKGTTTGSICIMSLHPGEMPQSRSRAPTIGGCCGLQCPALAYSEPTFAHSTHELHRTALCRVHGPGRNSNTATNANENPSRSPAQKPD
jgi:hypothetical protein